MVTEAIRRFLRKHDIGPCRLVAAVSGGTDSTALLLALADLRDDGFDIVAAHVNHRLRGASSDADEAFVRELCASLSIDVRVADGTLDEDRIRDRGIEAAAREVRYARLLETREATGARLVATAHQKNDQAETIVMRLLTGSGIAGLRGIHPLRDDGFVRPLLDVTRADLQAFLAERGVTPRHDSSNDDPRFLRNRVRALLRELGGVDNLTAVAAQAQQLWPIVEAAIDRAEDVEASEDATRFRSWPDDPWLRQALLHRHIRRLDPSARDVSAADLARLASEVESVRRVTVTKHLELAGNVLRKHRQPIDEFEIEFTTEAFIAQLNRTIRLGQPTTDSRQRFQVPPNATPRFTVRNRRRGDRFQPLGLGSPKKLKEFLIDRKIAAGLRDSIPLLVWNGEIVWVAGVEISERFKVTDPPAGMVLEVWLEGGAV
jgi:tRNA(Ile)-lysidine synthase